MSAQFGPKRYAICAPIIDRFLDVVTGAVLLKLVAIVAHTPLGWVCQCSPEELYGAHLRLVKENMITGECHWSLLTPGYNRSQHQRQQYSATRGRHLSNVTVYCALSPPLIKLVANIAIQISYGLRVCGTLSIFIKWYFRVTFCTLFAQLSFLHLDLVQINGVPHQAGSKRPRLLGVVTRSITKLYCMYIIGTARP